MRSTRAAALSASFLLSLGLLAACSGDDESPTPDGSDDTSESPTGASSQERSDEGAPDRVCKTTVQVTGDEQFEWNGKGESRSSTGGGAVYTSENEGARFSVYSGGDGSPALNLITADGYYATTADDAPELDAADNGKRAQVDASIPASEGEGQVSVIAKFTCK